MSVTTRRLRRQRRQRLRLPVLVVVLLAAAAALVPACATVAPWQRGKLSRATMQTSDDPAAAAFTIHVRRTREAMRGATSGGGPSCGCN